MVRQCSKSTASCCSSVSWMVEAILSLDVLVQAIGPDQNVKIALPKSMDINAVFDHRASLPTVGLDRRRIIEVAADLIRVEEAIWLESATAQSSNATPASGT